MILKQITGYNFYPCLNYVLSKPDAALLGSNMEGETASELTQEFQLAVQQHHRLKAKTGTRPTTKAVYHATLSVPINQRLPDDTWQSITEDYLQQMEFDDNQYILVRHQDTLHDHVHIVSSVLKLDGSTVNTSWNYYKGQAVVRQLEAAYNLEPVANSWEIDKAAPSTGQMRRLKNEQHLYEMGFRDTPPAEPAMVQLQKLIDGAAKDCPSLPQLIDKLEKSSVTVRTRSDKDNNPTGISFCFEGVWFAGRQLGRAYSLPGLQKHRGVVLENTQAKQEAEVQLLRTQKVAPIVAAYLKSINRAEYEGNSYAARWEENQLVLERSFQDEHCAQLMKAAYIEREWQPIEQSQLSNEDVLHFEKLIPIIQQLKKELSGKVENEMG